MMKLSTLRYGEEAYDLRLNQPRNIRLELGVFAVCRTENALCEAGVSTLADMRNLNTIITAKLDEYALRSAAPKPLFVRAMEYLGKLQIDTRKIERLPQYFRPPWTNIDHNRFDNELRAIRRGASKNRFQAVTFHILNEKYEHHSKIYIDGSKKDEKVGHVVVLSKSTIKKDNSHKTRSTALSNQP
jgi:hypothetical protein